MGTQVQYTPLYGAGSDGPGSGLLQIDSLTLLLDCGWDDRYDLALLAPVRDVLGHVDAVLISHPDPQHLGALPYLVGRAGLSAPVYATYPVQKMGEMFMYEAFLAHHQEREGFAAFDLDDVDAAFSAITPLKYQQTLQLQGAGAGFSITPFVAGHLLGGALWRVTTPDEEHIVYAVAYNHRKEAHLNGAVLDSAFSRPAVLITDAGNALQTAPANRAQRDGELIDALMATLRSNGSALVAVDTAGRVLELALLLERHWERLGLPYPLAMLAPMARNVLAFAGSQLEWMSDSLPRALEHSRANPFALRHVRLCASLEELGRLPPGPKVVMASLPSLEAGGSRHLLARWAGNPTNLVLFTARAQGGTLAAALQQPRPPDSAPLSLKLQLGRRVPLQGAELAAWQEAQRAQQQATETSAGSGASGDLSGGSPRIRYAAEQPTRMSVDTIGKVARTTSMKVEEAGSASSPRSPLPASDVLIDGFNVPEGAAAPMFPFEDVEDDLAWDDYGAALRPGEFQNTEEFDPGGAPGERSEEEDEAAEGTPSKVVSAEVALTVRARVLTLDYEGLADGRSQRTLLQLVAPRHLVLAQGPPEATEALREACAEDLAAVNGRVHAPANGQTVDVSPGSSSFQLALADGLVSKLKMRPMGDYQMAWVHGVVGAAGPGGLPELLPPEEALLDEEDAEDAQGGIFIGDVKLSALRGALAEAGIAAEFAGGALLCGSGGTVSGGGSVSVRRSAAGDGEVLLEGPLCRVYYAVRDVLYAQYHVC